MGKINKDSYLYINHDVLKKKRKEEIFNENEESNENIDEGCYMCGKNNS